MEHTCNTNILYAHYSYQQYIGAQLFTAMQGPTAVLKGTPVGTVRTPDVSEESDEPESNDKRYTWLYVFVCCTYHMVICLCMLYLPHSYICLCMLYLPHGYMSLYVVPTTWLYMSLYVVPTTWLYMFLYVVPTT